MRQLVEHGHQVTATTHSTSKVERLRAAGAVPVWNTWRDGFRAALIETTVPATYIRRDGDIPSLQRR